MLRFPVLYVILYIIHVVLNRFSLFFTEDSTNGGSTFGAFPLEHFIAVFHRGLLATNNIVLCFALDTVSLHCD
jgi:hypothetical protein